MFLMLRSQWEGMKALTGQPLPIDISATPMARVAKDAELVAAVAERKSDYEAMITVYRHDPQDPKPINVDKYLVRERIPDHRDFSTMVKSASTSANENMRHFLAVHVFLLKENAGADHWLSDLPLEISAVITRRSTWPK
jgi:hypothetical protein